MHAASAHTRPPVARLSGTDGVTADPRASAESRIIPWADQKPRDIDPPPPPLDDGRRCDERFVPAGRRRFGIDARGPRDRHTDRGPRRVSGDGGPGRRRATGRSAGDGAVHAAVRRVQTAVRGGDGSRRRVRTAFRGGGGRRWVAVGRGETGLSEHVLNRHGDYAERRRRGGKKKHVKSRLHVVT